MATLILFGKALVAAPDRDGANGRGGMVPGGAPSPDTGAWLAAWNAWRDQALGGGVDGGGRTQGLVLGSTGGAGSDPASIDQPSGAGWGGGAG
jgi:hypothetical protein